MSGPRTWDSYSEVPDPELVSVQRLRETQPHASDSNLSYVRTRFVVNLKWAGVDQATMLWHLNAYDPINTTRVFAGDNDEWLLVDDASANQGDTTITIDNFDESGYTVIYPHYYFFINGFPTLYHTTAQTSISSFQATLTVSPALQAAVPDNWKVFPLKVSDVRSEPANAGMYNIHMVLEGISDYREVEQCTDDDAPTT